MSVIKMVTYDQLMQPLVKALVSLGGSASIDEMYEEVVELENFDEETLAVLHNPEKSSQTEVGYRLAWARTYLKKAGYLENSARGVWALTDKARNSEQIDSQKIVNYVRSLDKKTKNVSIDPTDPATTIDDSPEETLAWRERLHQILIEEMSPDAFERLTQRLLRESGFVHVEVTGRTGDGGIDGKGIARINGLMSFHIAFQCKKYKGSVGSPEIRDFRGATVGRADRGLFITTGSFTKAAIEEANRDGASPIDLVDGDQLADKLKDLSLGVKTELVEKVSVEPDWFLKI
ncbi:MULTISPECIES: restriction endonuclease [Pseudoalteromonas]|uniref:restriction endonuclease n=1 Tax=Pseudoalteromonas TaxID=53246 RepID=UPI0005660B1E|nr:MULTISPECIES: restriction endonuclease [Pseudoalteromonas]MAY57584.1 restriction endonuclease [Pseudoalteromonas sp.]MDN3410725.1 restriction endonuclease [Pseudoalteromonas sp. APC 3894]MDN3418039.1 restriction endonuclease [Pseudoalteromonas sp. APC 3227]MDN3421747.1 restriction endonuclease [Pseudoalteromonas sp. APC 3895]MDN3425417.1 restriction endonuclease [Pseudoalteromonas sp. APC 3896]|tara:strand:- start:917 stop:1786 length:870 start_codon:yes stop_codon:yes gene_type:complete